MRTFPSNHFSFTSYPACCSCPPPAVELLLPSPSAPGTKVWAPLCAANYGVWGDALARAVCRQRYIAREQLDGSGRVVQSVGGISGNFSFAVPSGG